MSTQSQTRSINKGAKGKKQVQEPAPEVQTEDDVVEQPQEEPVKVKKPRRVVTRESVITDLDALLLSIDKEILLQRDASAKKQSNVKFLRSISKQIKVLNSDVNRVTRSKRRNTTTKVDPQTSGLMKQVPISDEMRDFTSAKPEELRSRVEVTKFLCNYIKDNDLQNPADRRKIIPDDKLAKILNYNNDDGDLTYYSMQTKMQHHFIKPNPADATKPPAKPPAAKPAASPAPTPTPASKKK